MHRVSLLFSLLLLSACLDGDESTSNPSDDDAGDSPGGDITATQDGEIGHLRIITPEGARTITYVVRDGHAIHEGDVDLGPVGQLHRLRGGAVSLGNRWPNGRVYYRLANGFGGLVCGTTMTACADVRTQVRTTLASMAQKLPLSFIEDTSSVAANYITFDWAPSDAKFGGSSNSVGMKGGEQTIVFPSGHLLDTTLSQAIPYNLQPDAQTLRHEMLHALGLWHEQSRSDRDGFITINTGCIQSDQLAQFETKSGETNVGPYDFASIMHYPTTAFCIPWLFSGIPDPDGDGCACPAITSKVAGPGGVIGGGPRPAGFSIEDANTLYRMYARPLGSSSANDHYGRAIAIGDLDNDGYDDMAVGVPDADIVVAVQPAVAIAANAGRVVLYKGTSNGLVAWDVLTENDYNGAVTANGRFGTALAMLDLDADGIKDLAVGAPGADGNAGAVFTFLGNVAGKPAADLMLTQASAGYLGEPGDRFGEALAAGPVTGLKRADPCNPDLDGKPYDALVVGAPGDRNAVPFSSVTHRSGAAYLFHEVVSCGALVAGVTRVSIPRGGTGDDFGAALAVGDLDGDGKADVVIGAPHRNANSGAVYTYKGRLPPEPPVLWSPMVTAVASLAGSTEQQLGAALAIGDVDTEADGPELVVGAPGRAGSVSIYVFGLHPVAIKNLANFPFVLGDRFGAALAIGNVDNLGDVADLVVGIPGQDAGAGAIAIIRGGTLSARTKLRQSDLNGVFDNGAGDQFGASLAIGNLDGRAPISSTASPGAALLDLAIGAPGEAPELLTLPFGQGPSGSGGVTLMKGNLFGVAKAWMQISQAFAGVL